ncbi:MAG: fasciclin domain-containing protein [Bacteroidales bacterium]|nr:fasciclin domain-containing protein [Bacteroidales bacterium]
MHELDFEIFNYTIYYMKLKILLFSCLLILIISCEKETALDEYYNQEGNYSGSIYNALDSTGLYTFLIQGIDSVGLKNQLEYTLVTVIAPSDKAFQAYMQKHGYDDISSIPSNILHDLIGHHVITWPNSPSSFVLDKHWFKRISNMTSSTVDKFDQKTGNYVTVLSEIKYVQFYFPEMLSEYQGNADDYKLLSGSDLSSTTGFNIYNVPVDSIVPYGNGWVYYVDQVIEPVQNLDDWLMNSTDYSLFNSLFNRFSLYYTDGDVSSSNLLKRSNLYQNQRDYRIDMELCFEPVGFIKKGNSRYSSKASSGFTVFAPENSALESFIDEYFEDYPEFKESLLITDKNSLDYLHIDKIVRAIVQPYMFIDLLIFPSTFFKNEGINSKDGTNFHFSEQDIKEYNLCSNGYGYGINSFIIPRTFKSILKPAFTSPDFKYFAAAVEACEIFGYLNDVKANYTLILPSDSAFLKNNILLLTAAEYNSDYGGEIDTRLGLEETVFYNADTSNGNTPHRMEVQDLFELVFNHVFTESVTPSLQKQFAMNAMGKYVGLTIDSVWSGGNMFDIRGNPLTGVPNIVKNFADMGIDNGQVYVVDDIIRTPVLTVGEMISFDPAFSRFKDLCENAGLLASNGELDIYGNTPSVFIPTNAAIDAFIFEGKLPSDEEGLQAFIKYCFMDRTIFTSESINETITTLCKDEELSSEFKIIYKTAELIGSYENLTIKGTNNADFLNVIEEKSNIICTDGIIHQIDGVLY